MTGSLILEYGFYLIKICNFIYSKKDILGQAAKLLI